MWPIYSSNICTFQIYSYTLETKTEKQIRESLRIDKDVRNRVDLMVCLVYERDKRNREQ